MRKKPDINQYTTAKDPTSFLESGGADVAEKLPVTATLATRTPNRTRARIQKTFNFSENLANQLRDEALHRSKEAGFRVTETDIVTEALKIYLNLV